MHQRKVPKLKGLLHSIPIPKDDNKRLSLGNRSILNYNLRCLSSGIPLACIAALLLIGIVLVNPISAEVSFALEGGVQDLEEKEETENKKEEVKGKIGDTEGPEDVSMSEEGVGKIDEVGRSIEEGGDEEIVSNSSITPLSATDPKPEATLTVSGDLSQTVSTGPGQTAYRSHNITVNLQDVTSYALQVSYADGTGNTLRYDGTGNANSTINATMGKTGSNLEANTWGYAWVEDVNANTANLTYQAMPNYGSATGGILKSEKVAVSGKEVITKKINGKLVFAVKFGEQAPIGHYKTQVLLSLAAAPKSLVPDGFGGILNMQDMTSSICSSVATSTTGQLADTRDNAFYTVAKLADGKCWMTQNLMLVDKVITPADSDVSSNYTVPASNINGGAYYANNEINGAYYTCSVASAETCEYGKSWASSICPKGWRAPGASDYQGLINISSTIVSGGRILGGAFFPYTGSTGRDGEYWEMNGEDSRYTFFLYISDDTVFTKYDPAWGGYGFRSLRCVAK